MPGKRFTRDQARSAVLAAGVELAIERGPSIGLARVSFAEAIERAGVPRPSAYRAFGDGPIDPQQLFRHELIVEIVDRCTLIDTRHMIDSIDWLLADARRDDITSDELTYLLRECIRVCAPIYRDHLASDPHIQPYMTALAASRNRDDDVTQVLGQAAVEVNQVFAELFRKLGGIFGVRLRAGWTWEGLANAIALATFGEYLLRPVMVTDGVVDRPTGPDGEDRPWTSAAVLIEGVVSRAIEPNPRMVVSAQTDDWE